MKLILLPRVIALILLGGTISVATAQREMPNSKRVRFPDTGVALSISIPEGWTTITAPNLLVIKPKVGNGRVSISMKDNVADPQAELKKALDYAKGQGVELSWESDGEATELNDMKSFQARGSATKDGERWMLAQWIFTADGKRYFSMSVQGREKDEEIHRCLEGIARSIKPLTVAN